MGRQASINAMLIAIPLGILGTTNSDIRDKPKASPQSCLPRDTNCHILPFRQIDRQIIAGEDNKHEFISILLFPKDTRERPVGCWSRNFSHRFGHCFDRRFDHRFGHWAMAKFCLPPKPEQLR